MNKTPRKLNRKLKLSRETVRQLTDHGLRQVQGGLSRRACPSDDSLCSECYCPSNTDCSACPTCPF